MIQMVELNNLTLKPDQKITVAVRDVKIVFMLTLLLIILLCAGCFYTGMLMNQQIFVDKAKGELDQLLLTNFSYVCYYGQNQYYIPNVSLKLDDAK